MSGASDAPRVYRGSRKHILDWVESPKFVTQLREMLQPVAVNVPDQPAFVPIGYGNPTEAQLHNAELPFEVLHPVQAQLRDWWLAYPIGAKTPNWDLVVECEVEGRPGLVLVEAKANQAELKTDGKTEPDDPDTRSGENHRRIRSAIAAAQLGLAEAGAQTRIDVRSHYQLVNRIAFTWKLATLGIPTILVYLGFTGDTGIWDVGRPFSSHDEWRSVLLGHAAQVAPESLWDPRIGLDQAPMWMLIRSLPVREASAPSLLAARGNLR